MLDHLLPRLDLHVLDLGVLQQQLWYPLFL
jgi:hypothetical protein